MIQRWLKIKLNKKNGRILRLVSFVVSVVIITFFLPKSGQFKYEYEKGRPWRHSNLIAPFDFPIYKSSNALRIERDSLLKNFRPYYQKTTITASAIRDLVHNHMQSKKNMLRIEYPSLYRASEEHPAEILSIEENLVTQIDKIYHTGIIQLHEEHLSETEEHQELMLISGNMAEPYELQELMTAKQAYSTLLSIMMQQYHGVGESKRQKIYNLLTDMDLDKLLVPDIYYNAERTEQETQNTLKNLSITTGKVLLDQRIIGTGDIVDDQADKIIKSLKREYEMRIGESSGVSAVFIGQLLIVTVLLISVFLFLYYFKREVYENPVSMLFILLMMVLVISVSSLTMRIVPNAYYMIPITILPITLRIFFDSRLSFYIHVATTLIISFHANNSFQFAILHIPAGMVAIFTLFNMARRSQIVRSMLFITITYILMYSGLLMWQEGTFVAFRLNPYLQFMINGILILLSYPLIYILEKSFGFISDVTLMELSDINHPLMRQLAEKAPGTFQHSIQVGTLAQEVTYRIGGNPMLVRAGAMYHDIGKMSAPMFFTENQISGINPHNELDYQVSAQIIISHVENGVKLARKNNLPKQIIDFINTHHGTTKARYFFNSYVNTHPGEIADESLFSYPGPRPFTKETAIVMMADSIEASSRSLKVFSDKDIDQLVDRIIDLQMEEKQFDYAPITFKEIRDAREVFKEKLKNIYHARIEYPEIVRITSEKSS